jgi:hypothetical protein
MNEPDEGLKLAIFNADGIVLDDHEIEGLAVFSEIYIRFKGFASSICFMINLCIR